MTTCIINCFCTTTSEISGNSAAVVFDFDGGKKQKQEIAKGLNLPVTVFVSDQHRDSPALEYFYPETEMPLCLHGTIAAAELLLSERGRDKLQLVTAAGATLNVSKEGAIVQVEVGQQNIPTISINEADILKMLNLDDGSCLDKTLPLTIASVGSPKLLIPFTLKEHLLRLQPNFLFIKEWSIQNKVNGLYVYTPVYRAAPCTFTARGFNPKTGHNEDAATGVAAAALALCLRKDIIVLQGASVENPCEIIVKHNAHSHLLVGGTVKQVSTIQSYG